MTPQEAIKFLTETIAGCHVLRDRQLKAVCEISINALEKQIPKKPEESYDGYADGNPVIDYHCPNCYREVDEDELEHHCECGQALDWSDTEWQ